MVTTNRFIVPQGDALWMSAPSRIRLIERAMRKYCSSSARKRLRIYDRAEGRCVYCGDPLGDDWQIDHLVPRAQGGSDHRENLVASCCRCNAFKLDRTPSQWFARIQVFC